MLISNNEGVINLKNFKTVYSCELFKVYINGILFCRGFRAGKDSINYFCDQIKLNGNISFDKLYGSYTLIIDYNGKEQIIFSDNSCMHGFFISKNYVGSNFQEIIKAEGIREFDELGLIEYMGLIRGGLSGRTYAKGITISDNLKYYSVKKGKRIEVSKGISNIDGKSTITDPYVFLSELCDSLSEHNIICALTGGFDSRAVAAVFNANKFTDCFISGDDENSSEIRCALKTADAGKYHMHWIRPQYSSVTNDLLVRKFVDSGCYRVGFSTSEFRIDYFMEKLATDGFEILVDGSAGDMHKEFWFTQEIPFYGRKKINPSFFYKSRMKQYYSCFGKSITDKIDIMEKYEIDELTKNKKRSNIESCLYYGWYNDWHSMGVRNSVGTNPMVYSPLQEIELVRYSINLSLKGKFLNTFLRRITTQANPKVARVRTVYGTTSSSEVPYMIMDIFAQMFRYIQQAIRYFIRRVFKVSVFVPKVNGINIDGQIYTTELSDQAMLWAKRKGFLKREADINKIPEIIRERLLNLYLTDKVCFNDDLEY